MEPEASQRELVVPLRPSGTTIAAVSLPAFMGAFFLLVLLLILPTSKPSAPIYIVLLVLLSLALMAPASFCIFYRCHARLVLSETGLRWRTWGEWRRASWNSVQDYFDVPPQGSSTGDKMMTIRTDAGDVVLNCKWQESEAVRDWVQARATHAAVTEWGVQGERSHAADTRTFGYDQKDARGMLLFIFGVLLPMIGSWWYMILRSTPRDFAGAWHPGNFWGSVIAVTSQGIFLLFSLVFVSLPLLIFLSFLPGVLDARKRRKERITVGENGITFEDGKRQVSASWDEVSGNFFQPLSRWRWVHVVETKHGSFEYTSLIEANKQLGKIIAARALPLEVREAPPLLVKSAGV